MHGDLFVREIPWPAPSPLRLVDHAHPGDRPFVLLSGPGDPELSRWSYAALEAVEVFGDFGRARRATLDRAATTTRRSRDDLPPFSGGAVGFISYDAAWQFAAKPRRPRLDPLGMPGQRFHRYDAIYARDELNNRGFVLTEATPDAEARGTRLIASLSAPGSPPRGRLRGPLSAKVSQKEHEHRIRQALGLIRDGEIYQVNLTYPLEGRFEGDPSAALVRLGQHAAPFSAYLRIDENDHLLSASPECFFDMRSDGRIRAFPIKGTRQRSEVALEDASQATDLSLDPKERAEHMMIVDLLRNDLGRLARPGSVSVEGLAYVESFPTIHHLTSRVQAYIRPDLPPLELLEALFPGGSITGAPKQRAMEYIDELEADARGVYTGSIMWLDRGGAIRASIAIRTAQVRDGELRFGVGGGIVADSDPALEWQETGIKARALRSALAG